SRRNDNICEYFTHTTYRLDSTFLTVDSCQSRAATLRYLPILLNSYLCGSTLQFREDWLVECCYRADSKDPEICEKLNSVSNNEVSHCTYIHTAK
ncbi:hypothetical protein PMAYCL1PPCAC_09896, partial [Pristionchus mayeri]